MKSPLTKVMLLAIAVVYYLDRDGYLLDKNGYYLLDASGEQIQLEQKHMNILKFYSLLQ
jgi:hypothetical protein